LALAETPKAEALLDGYVAATGGKAAYEAIRSQRVTSTVEFVAQGIKAQTVILQAAGGNSISTMEIPGAGKIMSGTKDGISWESSAMQGTRLREGEEKIQNLRMNELGGVAKWRDYTEAAEVVGEESVDGVPCWKLRSKTKGVAGEDFTWIDKSTGLMKKSQTKVKSQMGDIPMESFIREYRKEGGVLMPVVVEQKAGPMTIRCTVDKVEINVEVPAGAFEPPAEVIALLAKKK
jgi:hypothetical protein